MKLDWPNLLAGAILGFLAHWAFAKWKEYGLRHTLKQTYGHLSGKYANYRVEDGTEKKTAGTIKITWQSDGSFEILGLHANGEREWESTVRMSLDFKETGTGHYRYTGPPYTGTQELTYFPETKSFTVVTTNHKGTVFVHRWKHIED